MILLYHRVCELASDPQRLSISPQLFREHVESFRNQFNVVSLRDLAAQIQQGDIQQRTIAITFDDGYVDNLHFAKPILEEFEIPATVFVTYEQQANAFWWDQLEQVFLRDHNLPAQFDLDCEAAFDLADLDSSCERFADWNIGMPNNPTRRHALYRSICERMRQMQPVDRSTYLQRIMDWAGVSSVPRESHARLNADQLVALAQGGLIEIGSHAVTHSVLSRLSEQDQQSELVRSKHDLEAVLKRPVSSFAYPFGTGADYTRRTVELVKDSGYEMACTNIADFVRNRSNLFQLPRLLVQSCRGEQLSAAIEDLFAYA
jgi:peptidoglycan/xylan/chitin deacetylase (PgdA/CDA1 family)